MDRNTALAKPSRAANVALRKESVDRNSSREVNICIAGEVALRKESVDRNLYVLYGIGYIAGRSPQGERG